MELISNGISYTLDLAKASPVLSTSVIAVGVIVALKSRSGKHSKPEREDEA
jgi:hypothetical protein